jgi:hypothetical protein
MAGAITTICDVASLYFKKNKASDELTFVPLLNKFLNTFK